MWRSWLIGLATWRVGKPPIVHRESRNKALAVQNLNFTFTHIIGLIPSQFWDRLSDPRRRAILASSVYPSIPPEIAAWFKVHQSRNHANHVQQGVGWLKGEWDTVDCRIFVVKPRSYGWGRTHRAPPPNFSVVWNVHQSKMRNCEANASDDQIRSQSTYKYLGVCQRYRNKKLESAWKGAPMRGVNPSPTPHSFYQTGPKSFMFVIKVPN